MKNMKSMKNMKVLKLLKMLKQLKNGYTLTVLNFKQQFVPQKWPGMGKDVKTEGLNISSRDLKKALVTGT